MARESAAAAPIGRKRSGTPAPSARSGRHPVASKLTAVIVDDDADIRAIFSEVLEHAGWQVRTYAHGATAVRMIAGEIPDVVLTDINLGGLTGRGLARALRADPKTENVVIVAMSGSVSPSTGMLRAFDAFLPKPVEVSTLSEVLLRILESASD